MNSRELVTRAISFTEPDRVPLLFRCDPNRSDIVCVGFSTPGGWTAADQDTDEWGRVWANIFEAEGISGIDRMANTFGVLHQPGRPEGSGERQPIGGRGRSEARHRRVRGIRRRADRAYCNTSIRSR